MSNKELKRILEKHKFPIFDKDKKFTNYEYRFEKDELIDLMKNACESVIPQGDSPIPQNIRERFETLSEVVVAYEMIKTEIADNTKELFNL